jgi:hypothetical protein
MTKMYNEWSKGKFGDSQSADIEEFIARQAVERAGGGGGELV